MGSAGTPELTYRVRDFGSSNRPALHFRRQVDLGHQNEAEQNVSDLTQPESQRCFWLSAFALVVGMGSAVPSIFSSLTQRSMSGSSASTAS